jgi:DNA-binding SARP family transcriptional activator
MPEKMVRAKRLVTKLAQSDARLLEFIAPAGFGKSTLARAIGEAVGAYEIVTPSGEDLIRSLEAHSGQPFVAIVDRVDAIPPEEYAAIASAIEWAPARTRVILCSRRRTELHANIVLAPNERLTLTADDLAFRPYEAHSVFEGLNLDDERLASIDALCEGWPVAILSFKRAVQDAGVEFDGKLTSRYLTPLVAYLSDNIIETLGDKEWDALLLCCAMPGLQRAQLTKALDAPAAAFRLADMGLVRFDNQHGMRPRVLLRELIDWFFAKERDRVLVEAAAAFQKADLPLHAAAALLNAGDFPAAEDALRAFDTDPKLLTTLPYQVLSSALRERIRNGAASGFPRVWIALFPERRYEAPPAVLYREAVNLETAVTPGTPLHAALHAFSAIVATETGFLKDAEERLDGAAADENSAAFVTCSRAMIAAYRGDMSASAIWTSVRAQFWGCYAWLTLMMRLDLKVALAGGERPNGMNVMERMVAAAEKSGSALLVAHVVAASSVTAWICGDDELFNESLRRLKAALRRTTSRPLYAFFEALAGRYDRVLDDYPVYSGYARMVAAASNPQNALPLLESAMQIADRIGDLGLQTLARAAYNVATSKPKSAPSAGFEKFLARYAALRAPEIGAKSTIRIEIASGHVYRDDAEVSLSRKNLELCMLLAVEGKPLSRDAIFSRLWPEQAPDATYSTLKMCVHRTRQQLGVPDAIVAQRGCYALAGDVATDARMLLDQAVKSDPAAVFDMLRRGRPSEFAAWDWFLPIEERLIATTIDLGLELASRALNEGMVEKALEYAALLTNIDPTSEEATEVLIRAHLQRGERSLAISRYQRLLRSLKSEMQAEPSLHIQSLVH